MLSSKPIRNKNVYATSEDGSDTYNHPPPMNTVNFRYPDYAQGRDSITSIMGSLSSARVQDPHFADCNNQLTHY